MLLINRYFVFKGNECAGSITTVKCRYIDTKDNNNMNSVASRERTNSNIPVGLWIPMNSSFVFQHLKDLEQKKAIDVLLKEG